MTKLAVLFPGIGYNGDRPLLYYGRKLAEKNGYACKVLPYVYKGDRHIRGNVQKMEEAFQLYVAANEMRLDHLMDKRRVTNISPGTLSKISRILGSKGFRLVRGVESRLGKKQYH